MRIWEHQLSDIDSVLQKVKAALTVKASKQAVL
jgi:hypothetical protein